jgi:hypothetical protein
MAFGNGPKIVTDGLVLALDAADQNSYVSGSTTWNDVSNNNNSGSLVNGPTFSSTDGVSIVFNGTNNYIATSYAPTFNDFSAIVWFKSTANITYGRIVDKNFSTGMWVGRNSNIANSWGGGVFEAVPPYGRYITLVDGAWHMIASVRQGTTHTIYGDGIANNTSGTVSGGALSATAFAFGLNRSTTINGNAFGGNIAAIQVYNRALSATEIQQNYEAQKSRFNIT